MDPRRTLTLIKLISVFLVAFTVSAPARAQSATQTTPSSGLSIGIFADADSLPLLVAAQEGLFRREVVEVSLVRFSSALERDSALQAGKIDGAVTDLLAVILANQGGFPLKITSLTNGRYGIAVSPKSDIRSIPELSGKKVAVSLNTIIHYFADWSASQAGLGAGAFSLIPVPKMPVRLEMLLSDQIAAAVLPEPFLTTAKLRGAKILASSDDSGLEAGVLAFPPAVIAERTREIAALYRAYWEAAQRINANPDAYRSVLVASLSFPEEAARVFVFPNYQAPHLPSEASIQAAERWLLSKGLIKAQPKTDDLLAPGMVHGW